MLMDQVILLPLYIYPQPGAWKPLYNAIEAHPNLKFMTIVNPQSGPGAAPWWPNADYAREIPKLNSYKNVETVGYVRAEYCNRAVETVDCDIVTYASRPIVDKNPELAMEGIFVDEVVNQFSDNALNYLDHVDQRIRTADGMRRNRTVIHNPGTAVQKGFVNANPGPDISVVAEVSYAEFSTDNYQAWYATSPYPRERSCIMLYGVPENKIADVAVSLRPKAKYLFLTSSTANFYEHFGSTWDVFVDAMAQNSSESVGGPSCGR